MKHSVYPLMLSLLTYFSYGQTSVKTKEVMIPYANGREVFRVCMSGCVTTFDDNKKYYWYTEFSGIKSSKGGSGGSLLHGIYKFYDENENLRAERNYYLGLEDGNEKSWDSLGNIRSQAKYNKGDLIYWKFQDEEKYWIELIGKILDEGSIKKVYSEYNSLLQEETTLTDFWEHIKTYYDNSGKLKEEYTTDFIRINMKGKYTSYFENGKIEVDGQYHAGDDTNIKVGVWKWYKSDGTIEATSTYKAEIQKWENGQLKVAGGYIYDDENNTWLKDGDWYWYTEEGKFQTSIEYKLGVKVTE